MARWPRTWIGMPEDMPLATALLAEMAPFVTHLAQSQLAPSTVSRHFGNLWRLGGEILRQVHHDRADSEHPARELLEEALAPSEGPLLRDATEAGQEEFDATCRKLYKFRSRADGTAIPGRPSARGRSFSHIAEATRKARSP